MTIVRYRAHTACLLVGLILGIGGGSVLSSDGEGHGLSDEGCVHITTSATVAGDAAQRVCNSVAVRFAMRKTQRGDTDDLTQTKVLQGEECRKV